jgi:hypothetical protein
MKLRSLSLKGFRSFADQARLDFPESGLVLIRGKNVDATGVSSGSGKSSILLAIAYALKYCPYDASQLQSWIGKEKLEVKLELDGASLTRGTRTSISVGSKESFGVAAVDKALFDHIGLNPSLLEALTYRPQQSRGLFLSKTNSEMQEFLSMLLGLEKFEEAIEQSNSRYKQLDEKFVGLVEKVRFYKERVASVEATPIEVLKDPQVAEDVLSDTKKENSKLQLLVDTQRTVYEAAQAKLDYAASLYRTKRQEIRVIPAPEFDSSELDKKRALLVEAERRLAAFKLQESLERRKMVEERSVLEGLLANQKRNRDEIPGKLQSLKTALAAECPTCGQRWNNAMDKTAYMKIELQTLEASAALIPDTEKRIAGLAVLEDPKKIQWENIVSALSQEVALLYSQQDRHGSEWATKETARIAEARAALLEEEKTATAKQQMIVDSLRGAWLEATRALTTNAHQIELYEQQIADAYTFNKRAAEANDRRSQAITELSATFTEASESLGKNREERNAELDLVSLLKGFMSAIFDEVLNEIAWNTNQMLSRIPNVSHVSLGFRSETVTGKGTVKRAIAPYLNIGGSERPLKAALSGGMLAAVELAVDLAVRKVISSRTGVTPGWLILDECFEGLGNAEKEAVMELLKQVSNDTLILVVDHSTEFKEFFTQIVEVEFQGGRSKITGKI